MWQLTEIQIDHGSLLTAIVFAAVCNDIEPIEIQGAQNFSGKSWPCCDEIEPIEIPYPLMYNLLKKAGG